MSAGMSLYMSFILPQVLYPRHSEICRGSFFYIPQASRSRWHIRRSALKRNFTHQCLLVQISEEIGHQRICHGCLAILALHVVPFCSTLLLTTDTWIFLGMVRIHIRSRVLDKARKMIVTNSVCQLHKLRFAEAEVETKLTPHSPATPLPSHSQYPFCTSQMAVLTSHPIACSIHT